MIKMDSALQRTALALLRRIAIAAASGVLAVVLTDWPQWLERAFKADEKTAAVWPIIWLIIEGTQKYLRERRN